MIDRHYSGRRAALTHGKRLSLWGRGSGSAFHCLSLPVLSGDHEKTLRQVLEAGIGQFCHDLDQTCHRSTF